VSTADSASWTENARCQPISVVLFTRQLSVLFKEGVPLLAALEGLVKQDDLRFSAVVDRLAAMVSEGYPLSTALGRFPRIFNRVYVAMIVVGEKTGGLHKSLDVLADWIERDNEWRQRIRGATTYPLFIIGLTLLMTFLLFHSVMPGFLGVFADMKAGLPWITRMMMLLTRAASNPGVWVLTLAGGGFLLVSLREYGRTQKGALQLFDLMLAVPGLGPLVHSATIARYTCALGTMLAGGAELLASLTMAAQASNNPHLMADSTRLVEAVTEGQQVSRHMLDRPDVYPPILAHMTRVGEEAGCLAGMYLKVADYYSNEVNHLVDSLGAALEPVLLAMVGSMVGVIVLSIFLPLYSNLAQLGL
jgi:type IV pilus assembly protein PilC